MEHRWSSQVAGQWVGTAKLSGRDRDSALAVLVSLLDALVPDHAEVSIVTSGEGEALVAAIAGTTLFRLHASGVGNEGPHAVCETSVLGHQTRVVVTETHDGNDRQRVWSVTPTDGREFTFETFADPAEPESAFVQALARAVGWELPAPNE